MVDTDACCRLSGTVGGQHRTQEHARRGCGDCGKARCSFSASAGLTWARTVVAVAKKYFTRRLQPYGSHMAAVVKKRRVKTRRRVIMMPPHLVESIA